MANPLPYDLKTIDWTDPKQFEQAYSIWMDRFEQARREGAYWAGVRDGFREGATLVLREVFRARFGDSEDELARAIAHADWPTWDDALRHVTTESAEQLRARLGL